MLRSKGIEILRVKVLFISSARSCPNDTPTLQQLGNTLHERVMTKYVGHKHFPKLCVIASDVNSNRLLQRGTNIGKELGWISQQSLYTSIKVNAIN
jgi:hypothetical protein